LLQVEGKGEKLMDPLILIQHGQSEHHVNNLTGGWTDTPLTDLGCRQAACVASRLKREIGNTSCRMFSSDLKRAFQTAQIIGQEMGVRPQPVPELREFNTGIAAGKTEEWADKHVAPRPSMGIGLDRQPFPQAETPRMFYARTSKYMDQLMKNQDCLTLLVTHGGTITNIIAWWLQLDAEEYAEVCFRTYPGSISMLSLNDWQQRTLSRLNDITHLYEAGLTDPKRLIP
jgi:probable phosphoglycerate mutase